MKKTIFNISALTTLAIPALAFAQTPTPQFSYVDTWVSHAYTYLRWAITFIMILMTIFFLYNVMKYIMNKEAAKAKELQGAMIRGIIGLFVAVAVWGIVGLLANVTGVNNQNDSPRVACPPGFHNLSDGTCGTGTAF